MNEIWKDVVGYEGLYKVSNFGNVKSLSYRKKKIEKIRKPSLDNKGYCRIGLCLNAVEKKFRGCLHISSNFPVG